MSGVFNVKRAIIPTAEEDHGFGKAAEAPSINCDFVSVLIYTPTTGVSPYEYFLGFAEPSKAYTLLGIQQLQPGQAWKPAMEKFFQDAGVAVKPEGIIRLDRRYVPGLDQMPVHAVYGLVVRSEMKAAISKAFGGSWVSPSELMQLHRERKLFSPDIIEIAINSTVGGVQGVYGTEVTPQHVFVGLDQDQGKSKKFASGFDMVVQAAQLGRAEQEALYKEFLYYTVPFVSMGWTTFAPFMKELGWQESVLPDLFRAFDIRNQGGLTFRDLLYGLAAAEPNTQHGGPPAEIRCRYIFRYYDRNGDGKLNFDEFRVLVGDIRKMRGLPYDALATQQEAEHSAMMFGENVGDNLGLTEFLTSVGQLKFRGTSHLLRSPTSVAIYLKTRLIGETDAQFQVAAASDFKPRISRATLITLPFGVEQNTRVPILQPEPPDLESYDLATHSVRVRKSGTILDIHSLWDIEHSGMFGKTERPALGPSANRIQSFDRFNQESQPNEMLNGLKYFERTISNEGRSSYGPKPAFDWGEVDRSSLAKCIISLCEQVREIMYQEPRLLEIAAPCYILGDIHGNFPDLICFEKALWRLGPVLTPATFLFLGDYVDRGTYGVEVVSYLFAQKILAPVKFNLLRGNHEIRDVQQMFTFFRECITKFGDKAGRDVWEAINSAFDVMPLAAIVDKKVFCVHGGIPPPWIGSGLVGVINQIPNPLSHPEEESQLSWELMWSDPIHLELITPEQRSKLVIENGFASNLRRGTAHVFTEGALESFLQKNGLSHVVRAHEVQQAGFQVQLGGKLLTVFSSSRYCGGSNEAACILADKFKLRTIRIDTA